MFLGFRSLPIRRPTLLIIRSIVGATIDCTIDRLWLPLVVRSSPIVVDRATTRTTNRTMTYHQEERPIGDRSKHCRSVARSPNSNRSYDQAIVRSSVTVALMSTVRWCQRQLIQQVRIVETHKPNKDIRPTTTKRSRFCFLPTCQAACSR